MPVATSGGKSFVMTCGIASVAGDVVLKACTRSSSHCRASFVALKDKQETYSPPPTADYLLSISRFISLRSRIPDGGLEVRQVSTCLSLMAFRMQLDVYRYGQASELKVA